MTTALYARVSTRDKGQDSENQLVQLREFASRQGWAIVAEYVDRATGKHSAREQFRQLFRDASQHRFEMVLFWSLDRFSREGVLETLNHLQRLTSYDVGYRSFTEQYLDSCGVFKDAVLSILATVAKQERIRISERVTAGMARAKGAGAVLGRPHVVTDRSRVRQLREAGQSFPAIAREMDLSVSTVARICKGPAGSAG